MLTRTSQLALIASLLAIIMSGRASAGLTYDLRVSSTGGKTATLSVVPGDFVDLDLWAVVTGATGNSAPEGFQYGYGSIVSTGPNIQGSLSATVVDPFTSNGAQNGQQADLDLDGDRDLGSNATAPNTAFLLPISSGMTTNVSGQFKLATIRFTLENTVNPDGLTSISINFVPAAFAPGSGFEALWQEDGAMVSSKSLGASVGVGAAVSIVSIPEPSSLLLLGLGALGCGTMRRRRR